jgi:2-isopropylmalate synthase
MKKVTVLDTTLRDGDTREVRFSVADKIAIAAELADAGVDVVEIGASTDPGAARELAAVVDAVRSCTLAVLTPASADAIDVAGQALRGAEAARIHLFHRVTSDPDEIARIALFVRRARDQAEEVEYSPGNAACADLDAVASNVRAAIRGGARVINVSDTAGRALPEDIAFRLRELRRAVPEIADVELSFHGHDDLGLATANALAALRAGASQVETAVNGLGARAGNTALEEIVGALHIHAGTLGMTTAIDPSRLAALSRLVEARSGVAVGAQKAIVGREARFSARRSGGSVAAEVIEGTEDAPHRRA